MLVAETDCYWLSLLVETGCDWFKLVRADCWNCLWPVQTGSSLLLKLAVISSNWLLLVVETGCDQFKLVLAACGNWLKLVRADCWNLLRLIVETVETGNCDLKLVAELVAETGLWLVQTGSCSLLKLAVISSNWFLLMVETGSNKAKPVVTRCAWQERWFKLVLADYEDWLWLVQTGCCWLFETGSSKAKPVVTGCAQQGMMAGTSSNWFLLIVETGSD